MSATPAATGGDTGGVTVTKARDQRQPVVQRDPGASRQHQPDHGHDRDGRGPAYDRRELQRPVQHAWADRSRRANASTDLDGDVHLDAECGPAAGRVDHQRTFAAQLGGNGTAHPVTGDTWTVNYTTGGVARSQTGASDPH